MRRLHRIATTLIVWATATSTLLGSVPHFVCRCPDGSIKHFCFGMEEGETPGCCTGKSCCATKGSSGQRQVSSGQTGKPKTSCCSQQTTSPKKPTPVASRIAPIKAVDGPVFKSAGCQKTLAQPEAQSLPRMTADANEIYAASDCLLPAIDQLISIQPLPAPCGIWHIHGPPRPVDIVTTLQRLTI